MSKKIFLSFIFLLIPLGVSAVDFPDGSVVQLKGSSQKYFIFQGQKMKIANRYTFGQLGISQKNVSRVEKSVLNEIPAGEILKISPPKIKGMFDMHEHFRAGGNMQLYLDIAKKLGVEKAVFVPTGMGPDNAGYKEHMTALLEEQKKHPDRVIAFCTIDEADPEAPKIFEKCLDDGGKGLKILGGHPGFYDVPLDSDIMKQIFQIAQDRDVPVLVHISIMTLPTAKQEFKNLLDQFPDVRVQFAHYCSSIYNGINTDQCAELLDQYPNLYVDLSMGGGIERYFKYMTEEGGIQKIKDFILKYQDRVFYGTDIIAAPFPSPTTRPKWLSGRMMCDFSLHQEKWYRCPAMNKKGAYALLPGFEFSEEVLKKLYVENPKKFFSPRPQ